jgi:hypothetical protein
MGSTAPGYGNGIVNIERLTLPAGLVCDSDGGRSQGSTTARN